MKKALFFMLGLLITASLSFGQTPIIYADYETVHLDFPNTWGGTSFEVVGNPNNDGNLSANCALTKTTDQEWGYAGIASNNLGGTIDFTIDSVFTVKVLAPIEGDVLLKLESSLGAEAMELKIPVAPLNVGKWATMTFDLTNAVKPGGSDPIKPTTDNYDKLVLIFDAGGFNSEDWYFDSIVGPSGFTAASGEQATFVVWDNDQLIPDEIKLTDNNGVVTAYNLYDNGTNGDATADDEVYSINIPAPALTGKAIGSSPGIGVYTWQVFSGGVSVSDEIDFVLSAGDSASPSHTLYEMELNNDEIFAYPTSTPPTIDGAVDDMWANYQAVPLSKTIWGSFSNPADHKVTVKTAYDADNMYFLAEIIDDTLSTDNGNAWEKDNFTIYLDLNNDDSYNGDTDGEKRWIWNEVDANLPGTSAMDSSANRDGWVLEIKIPLDSIKKDTTITQVCSFGIEFNAGDNDKSWREGIHAWHTNADEAWWNAAALGLYTFVVTSEATMTTDGAIIEDAEDGEVITVTITNDTLVNTLTPANWTFSNLPSGITIGNVERVNNNTVELTLSGNATVNYDEDIALELTIAAEEFVANSIEDATINTGAVLSSVVTGAVTFTISSDGEILEDAEDGEVITITLLNDAFATTIDIANWTIENLPSGVSAGSLTRVTDSVATLTLSGNATADYDNDITNLTVTISAVEFAEATLESSTNVGVVFTAIIELPAELSLASDGEITEGAEDGEIITVSISNDILVTTLTDTNWVVTNLPEGVTIGSITRVDDNTVEITLSGNASVDYDEDITNITLTVAADEFAETATEVSVSSGITITATIETNTYSALANSIALYPVPATNQITINNVEEISSINIYNHAGALVQTTVNQNSSVSIDISSLPNGYYIVELISNNGLKVNKQLIKY